MLRPLAPLLLLVVILAGCVDSPSAMLEGANAPVESPAASAAALLGATGAPPTLDEAVDALREAILAGETVTLPAEPAYLLAFDPRNGGAVDVELELVRSELVSNETWAEIDGERVPMPWIETYEGHLAGDPGSPARLTLGETFASGSVRIDDVTYRIRVGMDGNFPMGADWDAIEPEPAQTRAYLMSPAWTFDKGGEEPRDCLSLVPQPITPVVTRGAFEGEELVVDMILDTDAEMAMIFGAGTWPLVVAQMNEVDAIYGHQLGMRFRVVGLHAHTDPNATSDPEEEAPLADLAEYWNARLDVERDIVHLVTGHDSSFAQANCIGGAGMPEIAYTFTTIHWAKEDYGKTRHAQTFAHELGHIFNAHHHYGNPVEGAVGTTIMFQGGEKINPVFSTLSKSVIRGWTEAHVD